MANSQNVDILQKRDIDAACIGRAADKVKNRGEQTQQAFDGFAKVTS